MQHSLFNNSILDIQDFITIKKYKRNTVIFNENDICTGLYLIIKGAIKISTFTYFNAEYSIVILNENSMFGANLLFCNNNRFLGDIIALKETVIWAISKKKLLDLFSKDQTVLINYLSLVSEANLKNQYRIKLLSQKAIKDKIMFFLYSESKRRDTNIISIKSKEHIASFLNIPRPSLSRELINLKAEGLIDYNKNQIILHLNTKGL